MTLRVLVSGQSNSLGRATDGPSFSGVDSRVSVWNNINPLGADGSAFVTAAAAKTAGVFENTDRNNFAVWFCDRLARAMSDTVTMTLVARGGISISEWAPSGATYPMLAEMTSVWAATGQPPADVFLWHQGEQDVGVMTPANYRTAFAAMLANLQAAGVISANTIVIVGGLVEATQARIDFNTDALKQLPADDARVAYADSSNLESYDATHFSGYGLYLFGRDRYFRAYQEAISMSLYALVNDGGTPGEAGTGENKILNLDPVLAGYKLKGAPVVFTANGTYTLGADVKAVRVRLCGGGGKGGEAAAVQGAAGGGGGGGGYAEKFLTRDLLGASVAVTVGLGGTTQGQDGGTSSFGAFVSATGGKAGQASTGAGGWVDGGTGVNGDVSIGGGQGGSRVTSASSGSNAGGGSFFGPAAPPIMTPGNWDPSPLPATPTPGVGGGGARSETLVVRQGQNGAKGIVIVEEFV